MNKAKQPANKKTLIEDAHGFPKSAVPTDTVLCLVDRAFFQDEHAEV